MIRLAISRGHRRVRSIQCRFTPVNRLVRWREVVCLPAVLWSDAGRLVMHLGVR
jgi:hypothetical protein